MAHYIYSYLQHSLPQCIFHSFNSVRSVDNDAKLVLVTDQNVSIDNVCTLDVKQIISDQTKQVMDMKLFIGASFSHLWRTSIFRIFLIRDATKYLGLDYCYHFDSDVILFQSPNKFKHLISDFDGLHITPDTGHSLVFGFSKFSNTSKIDEICSILHQIVFDSEEQKKYCGNTMPNEMNLLGGIFKKRSDLITTLPILPFNNEDMVFDPSSYGQYFAGTYNGQPPGFTARKHLIGKAIEDKKITPVLIDNIPYVSYQNKNYPIVNLHIHSKKIEKLKLK
jgi:hypothetical protein